MISRIVRLMRRLRPMKSQVNALEQGGRREALVVLLHGMADAGERMPAVRQTIRTAFPDADIYAPRLPYARNKLCWARPEDIVARIVDDIGEIAAARMRDGEYRAIILVGHSYGAVLARRVAIVAFGEQRGENGDVPAPFEKELERFREPRPWARSIRRLVLLAGMNRGWSVDTTTDWLTSLQWTVGQLVGELAFSGQLTILQIRKGAPFLVQTRLQWLALMDPEHGPRPDIVAVQLLGTVDEHVAPDDNVDFSVDCYGNGERPSYFYIEVPHSGHSSIVEMAGTGGHAAAPAQRAQAFVFALRAERDALGQAAITREQMADTLPPAPDRKVKNVVFVVHGIRDKGYWTQKIARSIKREAVVVDERFESWTESYGYFAMLPFLFRTVRQRKVEWLMDNYAEARARFPCAAFHYVGHSNGTYLAAQALADYPGARFDRIVFAGSVVRRDYPWLRKIDPGEGRVRGQVRQVLNYVATRDWVVALFPKGLQWWRRFNLGSAGHDGFNEASVGGPVRDVKYIGGGHGAGHEEAHWREIARFVVHGRFPDRTHEAQSGVWRALGRVSWLVLPLALAAIYSGGSWILQHVCCGASVPEAVGWSAAFVLYVSTIFLVVTRF